ncbi:Uricase [Rubripirellula obstinata]|uniref:Uricase n=1 Tax=Rubripirellula obstinata TaxID=406547 RepID=A0A5B1CH36_9BACT|nr:urate oxidase [Rubripirellula obstinata]KAA1259531.1 Uricase [Rubripirellula obstinata]
MAVTLSKHSYGKSHVCLSYISRKEDRHDFIQLSAEISLEGKFDDAYTSDDNSKVVPTDTMKNTVYAIARMHGVDSIEDFAKNLAVHFCQTYDQVESATVSVSEQLWTRIDCDGQPHGHAFTGGGSEQNTCCVSASADSITMHSGLKGLKVLKTTESGFEGYSKDQLTTLAETKDRIFATTITAEWDCGNVSEDWTAIRILVRSKLLEIFAHRYSPSVQRTLHEMAEAVLDSCPAISEITLNMPNQHHIPADIAKLGLQNHNDIFVPTPEPFGVIEATIRRDG